MGEEGGAGGVQEGGEGGGPGEAAGLGGVAAGASVDGAGLVDALESVGFGATVRPTGVLEIEGMMCQRNCGSTVKGCLESVPGVDRAEVSFAEGLARVWTNDSLGPLLPLSEMVDAVEGVGFGARVVGRGELRDRKSPGSGAPAPSSAATAGARAEGGGGGGGGGGSGRGGTGSGPASSSSSLPKTFGFVGEGEEWSRRDGAGGAEGEGFGGYGGGSGGGVGDGVVVGVFSVSGMSCASCVGNVEKFVSALDGVEDVRVALLAEKVTGRRSYGLCFSDSDELRLVFVEILTMRFLEVQHLCFLRRGRGRRYCCLRWYLVLV